MIIRWPNPGQSRRTRKAAKIKSSRYELVKYVRTSETRCSPIDPGYCADAG